MLSFCMVAAQGVMLPIALVVGWNADRWGRRPIFLIAFAALPIRAALYTVSDNAFWLLGVQLLDGVGAGIYQALTPLLIADIMRGTGRYNLAQGAVATTQGVGAAVSALIAGEVTDHFGYSVSFWFLGAVAALACLVFFAFMPETRGEAAAAPRRPSGRALMTLANLASTNFSATSLAALVILALTYAGIALGRIPGLRLDRAGIALLGGAAMIALGPLSLDDAFHAIDFNTIALLLGMMIVVAHLKVSGAFRALGRARDRARPPSVRASRHGDAACRRAVGLPRQRRDLPRHGADGADGHAGARPQPACPISSQLRPRPTAAAWRRSPAIRRTW